MSRRYVLFAAVYRSGPLALDGLRVLSSADREQVAGPSLLHRDEHGRTTLERPSGSTVLRAALVGLVIGFAAGLGTRLMWATALIGAVVGAVVGHRDRTSEDHELRRLVGVHVPAGGYAVVALTEQDLARRLSEQFDLALETCMIPIAGRRLSQLARMMAIGNADVTRALDGP